jgi:Ca2+-binding RTX toxin-like protein
MTTTAVRITRATAGAFLLLGLVLGGGLRPTPGTEAAQTCFGATATLEDHSGVIHGTSEDDVIIGDGGKNTIYGLGGSDRICGLGDDDIVYGGGGTDFVRGSQGGDQLYGEEGGDYLFGGSGGDTLYGGPDDDAFLPGPGLDFCAEDDGPAINCNLLGDPGEIASGE